MYIICALHGNIPILSQKSTLPDGKEETNSLITILIDKQDHLFIHLIISQIKALMSQGFVHILVIIITIDFIRRSDMHLPNLLFVCISLWILVLDFDSIKNI